MGWLISIYSAMLHKEMISSALKLSFIASEFMKLLGCIKVSRNLRAMSNLEFSFEGLFIILPF